MATIPFNPMLPGNWLMRSVNDMPLEPVDRNPYAPQMPPEMSRYWQAAQLTGGNNSLEDDASIRRQYLLNIQRAAQRQAAQRAGYDAVQAGLAMQAQQAQQFNPNGVNNGIAFRQDPRTGQVSPVGFAGAVSGVAPGIPEAGFTGGERNAFQRELMKRVAAMPTGPSRANPMAGVVDAGIGGATSAPVATAPTPAEMMYVTGPLAPWRQALDRTVNVPQGTMPVPPELAKTLTSSELKKQQETIDKGLAERAKLPALEKAVPDLLAALSTELGVAVNEDVLLNDILREPANEFEKSIPLKYTKAGQYAARLGVDPKLLIRWAQDRKKAKT